MAGAATRNTVDCERKADSDGTCKGTSGDDKLLDEARAFTEILGGSGRDLYVEYSGSRDRSDILEDTGSSSDTYRIMNAGFVRADYDDSDEDELQITDEGGQADVLDLTRTGYDYDDCDYYRNDADDLLLDCPDNDDIIVRDYFSSNSIEYFKFDDTTKNEPFK